MRADLTDQRYGRLVALEPTEKRRRTSVIWRCRCDCGALCEVPSDQLRSGATRSCGCLRDETRRLDITGQRRGRLTAVRPTDERRGGSTVWQWRCDCGATVLKAVGLVRDGASTMCPACARALKAAQAAEMSARRVIDPQTGLSRGSLRGLREGRLFSTNTSGVRGVSWHAGRGKCVARMQDGGRTITLGYYATLDEAAQARARAVRQKYGPIEEDDTP